MAPGFKYGGDDLSAPFARQRIFISTVEQRQESINKEKSRSGVWHKLTIKSRHVSFTIYNVVSDRACVPEICCRRYETGSLAFRSAFALNVALSYPIRCIRIPTIVSIFSGGEEIMKLGEKENRNYFEYG